MAGCGSEKKIMINKGSIKFIHSLRLKKQRDIHQKFVVEGDKLVKEFLSSDWHISELFGLPEWLTKLSSEIIEKPGQVHEVTDLELKKISTLITPNQALAIVEKPDYTLNLEELKREISLLLCDIQDPGNLGTILRIAAWFGIHNIVCSHSTVDLFNSKVVQATMGAILHVNVHYVNAKEFLSDFSKTGLPIYGTDHRGKNIYEANLETKGIIIMGNESQGIPTDFDQYVNPWISIPGYGSHSKKIESLNVAVATAIVCAEFRRREIS